MKKFSFSALFENKTFVVILSIVLAFVCWSSVVFSGDNEDTRTIKNVPVKVNASSASYTSLGLDIIDDSEYFVDVVVAGPRSVIGSLTVNDIVVTPIISGVAAAGEYELELTAAKRNELDDYSIRSMTPSCIDVRFDVAVSKKFMVDTEIQGLSVRSSYLVGTITASPGEVNITGPEVLIENIDRVVARYVVDGELAKTAIFNCEVVLYDKGGNELSADNLKIDSPTIDVTVPVYKEGNLTLDIEFTNVPVGFDPASLNYVLSDSAIRVAANEQSIENLKTKIVGYVDPATFKLGETYAFDVNLPSGFMNLDNVQTVTVTFPQEGLASKKIVVSDIRLQNVPENYSVSIETPRINNVTVIGPQEDINALMPGSVIAIVDMSTVTMERGDYSVPVSFEVTANDTTFVVGSYSVLIEVRPN